MKSPTPRPATRPVESSSAWGRLGLVRVMVVSLVVGGAWLIVRDLGNRGRKDIPLEVDTSVLATKFTPTRNGPASESIDTVVTPVSRIPPDIRVDSVIAVPAVSTSVPSGIEPSAYTRQLVTGIYQIDLTKPMTPEVASAWKQSVQLLTQQGSAAIPAIQEFLARNIDLNFAAADPDNFLGQPTLRQALIETLRQIGGPEGIFALASTLQIASDPHEIAILARNLEAQAPEQYRDLAVNAAREGLAMAAAGKLPNRDLGPLFGVLQQYDGANAIPDLEKAIGQWRYYGAIGLVNLPEGVGIPSLVQMAYDVRSAAGRVAVEMLAQVADQSEIARDTLFAKARAGQLPKDAWMQLASVLGGEKFQIIDQVVNPDVINPGDARAKTYHISDGNQNFYSYPDPTPFSSDQINQRVVVIEQLMGLTRDPLATDALQKARSALLARPKP